ncbi:MAG: acyl-CoA dehydrogenase family protein [Planktotalea sp.]|jgi:butyryl-CoA dehydrogenase|uniref:acyl-CoA dehydrogenase family protein n=1 Tax=Planktotalea sp. TaxID=2029877 RepID=UPI000183AA80|nr:acyl-CoA dehydrogenase family protein [Planktotalea sp.]EDZ42915.1 acyl-CoA dehydrogenase protein FadFx [Rhodobacteraceae bacterium HTCC2083]MBT5821614.1 acyl-CoA dehydrogenase [Paracoccaceae bacterium]MDG1075107.1 acyl-CoA dehydrogenase family protein [Planktotalea sp.]MDG1085410.1 acyl-CoA dehydrogenase family protein [Planktotalea sp.]HCW84489.1 acyl-CoA dehydrogenase [Paracoccaceae bacterium]
MILNETQDAIREMTRQFAEDVLWPNADARDKSCEFPRAELSQMGELGLMGMLVPEEFGGSDTGAVAYALALEEIAAGDGPVSTILSVHSSVGCVPIVRFGNDAQKQKYLPKLASGEWIGGFALTEPQAGSDASNLKTSAVRDGDEWVINGAKQFITSGKNGQMIIIFAVTDKDACKRGISAFIVPTNTPGYEVVRVEDKLGLNCTDTCQLAFTDMRVPAENMLGEEGQGYKIALANLEGGRIGIAAQAVGMARSALKVARDYATERTSFGTAIANHQAVGFRLADMATQVEAARQMVLHAASLKEASIPCLNEASMAKLFASEVAEKVCSDAIQTLGGYGYLSDYPVERIYRDVRICQIYEGTSDIQRLVIARNLDQVA